MRSIRGLTRELPRSKVLLTMSKKKEQPGWYTAIPILIRWPVCMFGAGTVVVVAAYLLGFDQTWIAGLSWTVLPGGGFVAAAIVLILRRVRRVRPHYL